MLFWPDHDGTTELRVEPISYRTRDELLVSELVTLTHNSPWLSDVSPRAAAHFNRWATLSSLIPRDATQPGRLVCKVGIFAPDRAAAEQVYAPLVCTEAAIVGWYAAMLARGSFSIDPERSPLKRTAEPPPFSGPDFEACRGFIEPLGLLGTAGAQEFNVEFPWDPGAKSHLFRHPSFAERAKDQYSEEQIAQFAGRTSLLTLRTNEAHGLYGKGMLARLELPLPIEGDDVGALVDELNRWELSGIDLPPLFGSWCLGMRAPTFVTFVPNQMALTGLLQYVTAWTRQRAFRVCEWLCASGPKPSRAS